MASSRERGGRSEWGVVWETKKRYFPGSSSAQNLQAEGKRGKEGVDRGEEEEQVGRRKALTMGTIPKAESHPSTVQQKNHCVQR